MGNKFWRHLEEYAIGAILVAATLLVTVQCFVKYLAPAAMPVINELTGYLYIYIAFFGVGYATKYGADLTVNLFDKILPEAIKKALGVFYNALYVVFYTVLLVGAVLAVRNVIGLSGEATGIPMAGVYFAAVVGYGLGLVRWIERTILKKKDEEAAE